MKRRIILMRHAKSAWDTDAASDHERPLNKRGRRDAPWVAARLSEQGWTPESVLSSDSERTRETFALMEECFQPPPTVRFLRSFYLAGTEALKMELEALPDQIQTVLLLGHNPGWEGALSWLSGECELLKTANAALLENKGSSWKEATKQNQVWKLHDIVRPPPRKK